MILLLLFVGIENVGVFFFVFSCFEIMVLIFFLGLVYVDFGFKFNIL